MSSLYAVIFVVNFLRGDKIVTTPIMPVLFSDINVLSKPVDIIKKILQWYTSVPKNINDTFADQEISFRWDEASRGHDPDSLKILVQSNLVTVLRRYFPTASVLDVTVEISFVDTVRYDLSIDILITIDGVPYSISQDYERDSDGNLKFKLAGD